MFTKENGYIIVQQLCFVVLLISILLISACGGASGSGESVVQNMPTNEADNGTPVVATPIATPITTPAPTTPPDTTNEEGGEQVPLSPLDAQLATIISNFDWNTDPLANRSLPNIDSPLAQLGKKLFFSKSLGGDLDTACASCHHPSLGGADELSLTVGVGAIDPDVLGRGREHVSGLPIVPRNSPTNFNAGLWDKGLFFDSRVESLGQEEGANGGVSGIRTPDSNFGMADDNAGPNLVAAQARFPVTSVTEMRSENFEANGDNDSVRQHLAARIGNYGVGEGELARNDWLIEFQTAFGTTASAEEVITFDNIALALGEYQRSLVFINSPWQNYLDGDVNALSEQEKEGAILFFTAANNGGAGCSNCHSGPLLSDENHHTVAFPQFGPGNGDGNDDDFGRERETANPADRYRFRTPSLLNIAQSAPYGHAGAYETLEDVVQHYNNPRGAVDNFFEDGGACGLAQFNQLNNCASLYPNAQANSQLALAKLQRERNDNTSRFLDTNINRQENAQLVAFLRALSDPCVESRECLSPWIANPESDDPDDQLLNAVNAQGRAL